MSPTSRISSFVALSVALGSSFVVILAGGCSSSPDIPSSFGIASGNGNAALANGEADGGSTTNPGNQGVQPLLGNNVDGASPDTAPPCVNLQCQQVACSGTVTTTVSGTILDPAGKNPLYNVAVYVPNSTPSAFTDHATCDTCADLYTGDPLVTASTAADGTFTIQNVPAGTNIPLVVQIGKWRRQLTIPTVTACTNTALDPTTTRLPRNRTEGDLPKMAVSTGGADTLECLLERIGVDEAEYTSGTGDERVHIYQGTGGNAESGGSPSSQSSLWDSTTDLSAYDIVILSCEGGENGNTKPATSLAALEAYANGGGRVFASHFHYYWFEGTGSSPEFKATATWIPGSNGIGPGADNVTSASINTSFPKGLALDQWLGIVSALQSDGTLQITDSRQNASVNPAVNVSSQSWITDVTVPTVPSGGPTTMYLDFNTPIAATPASQCGRVVYSDLHVGAASNDYSNGTSTVPGGCTVGDLSAQEKALEFMLFDLSSCVTPDNVPPTPPAPTPPQAK
ncbi:MAG: carboxypeptidase regulatory-like domain-containing protein [Polyangiaceae bacterium]